MATLYPSKVLHTSPMNILAFCQFQNKKPKTEAASNKPILSPKKKNIDNPINMTSVLIYPSIPSKKLNKLINQTMAINAIGVNSHVFSKDAKPIFIPFNPERKNNPNPAHKN